MCSAYLRVTDSVTNRGHGGDANKRKWAGICRQQGVVRPGVLKETPLFTSRSCCEGMWVSGDPSNIIPGKSEACLLM